MTTGVEDRCREERERLEVRRQVQRVMKSPEEYYGVIRRHHRHDGLRYRWRLRREGLGTRGGLSLEHLVEGGVTGQAWEEER